MITKLLIANRGEIACRIIKTAKAMGIPSVAIYSEADASAKHVEMADEAVFIGPSPSTMSYLNIDRILEACKISGANAVHPGYGFLSENYHFAKQIEKNNLIFVGPPKESILSMGDKINAKKLAASAGVNIVPGYSDPVTDVEHAKEIAKKIGYPVMLKAAAGGGGKGIRIAQNEEALEQSLDIAQAEAMNNFSDSRTFIEKYIQNPRHIEIQVLGDKFGNYICLGERECSVQRHRQKVIEEAPSTFISEDVRQEMYRQSIALCKQAKYFSAGTVEFIVDDQKIFYFMEMNTRIQVEHPVTEQITGIDIVEQMINIAQGKKLQIQQKDVVLNGHATECRICAEDPSAGFLPSTGTIINYREPQRIEGLRIDSSIYEGGEVSMFYDSMISKVCAHGATREESISKMQSALGEYVIQGISTNITAFLQRILAHPRYKSGDISTHFVEEVFGENKFTGPVLDGEENAVILSAACFVLMKEMLRAEHANATNSTKSSIGTRWVVSLDSTKYPVVIRSINDGYKVSFERRNLYIKSKWKIGANILQCIINNAQYSLQVEKAKIGYEITFMGSTVKAQIFTPRAAELEKYMMPQSKKVGSPEIKSAMNGSITSIKVAEGEKVNKGSLILSIEAMKMENLIISPMDGIVKEIKCKEGDFINVDDVVAVIEPIISD